jgi:toxin ParE1/3/4
VKRLVFTPAARNDLLEIGAYIADDNPVRAESFVAELENKAY